MSKNITLYGTDYSDVPAVILPQTGGGTAIFTDITNTTAIETDVVTGKIFFKADGTQATGSVILPWTFITSSTITVNTTETTATSAGTISCGSTAVMKDAIIYVHIRGQSGKRNGYFYGSDTFFINYRAANNSSSAYSSPTVEYIHVNSDGTYTSASGSYGVYGYSMNSSGTITLRKRYHETNTLTINDTFDVYVYELLLPGTLKLFA